MLDRSSGVPRLGRAGRMLEVLGSGSGRSGQVLAKPRANLRQGRHRGQSTGRHWPADGDSDPIFLKN